jgi:hypothetical protein
MSVTYEGVLELREGSIVLQLRGKYDLLRLSRTIEEVGRLCRETGCRRILADARKHAGGIGVLDMHEIGEMISREIPRGYRVAVVVSEGRLEMDRFLETVALNRGVLFRLFTRTDEAEAWLTSLRAVI